MSARVFNPLVMSEMRRMIGRSSSDASPASVARVRRDLFGPVNHEDAQSFVDRELAAIRNRESEKWGFDFVNEKPLENSRFPWERVSPEENIPEAYALRRLFGQQTESQKAKDGSANTASTADQETTTQKTKSATKQSQITDFLKCRKRSRSVGEISARKVGSVDISTLKAGNPGAAATTAQEPTPRKRSRTRQ